MVLENDELEDFPPPNEINVSFTICMIVCTLVGLSALLRYFRLWAGHQGEYEEAKAYYQKALKIRVSKLGEDHPYVKETKRNLARL